MAKNRVILLDSVGIDYLGITSYDSLAYDIHLKIAKLLEKQGAEVAEHSQFLQYVGSRFTHTQGTAFMGMAQQANRDHYYMSISGELANDMDILALVMPGIANGWLKCSRLDLQSTIALPVGWSQWGFFNRRQRDKEQTGWHESTSKAGNRLRTVYVGNRENGHFIRVYEKEINDKVYLRLEFELKRGTARNYLRSIQTGNATPAQLFKLLLQRQRDKELEQAFAWVVEHAQTAKRPTTIVESSKTKEWLLTSVLPAFKREINREDADNEVMDAFKQAIAQCEKWHIDNLFD